jgi:ATP-binding cassette subfamily B protein
LDEQPEKEDLPNAQDLKEVEGDVQLKEVTFGYTEDKIVLKNVNVHAKKGQTVAIVGPTGAGKTTIINLLMRFYDVKSGSIAIDGIDIRRVTRESLRRQYGMVLQDTWIRSGTVRDNLTYGRPDATEEEIIAAAKASHCHRFIMQLPNGYDTILTERGGGLSEGQIQRLSIARALLANTPILLLDEATSALDEATEFARNRSFPMPKFNVQQDSKYLVIETKYFKLEYIKVIFYLFKLCNSRSETMKF